MAVGTFSGGVLMEDFYGTLPRKQTNKQTNKNDLPAFSVEDVCADVKAQHASYVDIIIWTSRLRKGQ